MINCFCTPCNSTSTFKRKQGLYNFPWVVWVLHGDCATHGVVAKPNFYVGVGAFDGKMNQDGVSPDEVAVDVHCFTNELSGRDMSHSMCKLLAKGATVFLVKTEMVDVGNEAGIGLGDLDEESILQELDLGVFFGYRIHKDLSLNLISVFMTKEWVF